jgi:hypothetical protein
LISFAPEIVNGMALMVVVGAYFALIVHGRPSAERCGTCEAKVLPMKQNIMNRMAAICVAMAALALPLLVGCAHEVSHTKKSSVSSNGTVKSTEKTVTQSSDGTVTTTEESKKTNR